MRTLLIAMLALMIFASPVLGNQKQERCFLLSDALEVMAMHRQKEGRSRLEMITHMKKGTPEKHYEYWTDMINYVFMHPRQIDPQDQLNAVSELKNDFLNTCMAQ